jgi:hypothetical protein
LNINPQQEPGPQTKRLADNAHRPLRDGEVYEPYVPATSAPDEFTVKALFFGIIFGVLSARPTPTWACGPD